MRLFGLALSLFLGLASVGHSAVTYDFYQGNVLSAELYEPAVIASVFPNSSDYTIFGTQFAFCGHFCSYPGYSAGVWLQDFENGIEIVVTFVTSLPGEQDFVDHYYGFSPQLVTASSGTYMDNSGLAIQISEGDPQPTATPEPSSVFLIGCGIFLLIARRRSSGVFA